MTQSSLITTFLAVLLGVTLLTTPFQPYLIFIVMNGLVITNSVVLYANLRPSCSGVDRILGLAVLCLSQVTVTQLYPGLMGYATRPVVFGAQIGCLTLTLILIRLGWLRYPSGQSLKQDGLETLRSIGAILTETRSVRMAFTLAATVFVFVFSVSALNPPISIDSIFFHMMRPVEWLQTGSIPPRLMTSYSYPHGIGLLTLWLLFPFHHDFVARLSQTPIILLGGVAVYGICRRLDIARPLAAVAALTVLTTPIYLTNGIALTDPDTLMAGTLLMAVYFAVSLARAYHPGTVVLLGLSLGLLLGSKYNAVYYGPPLVLLVLYGWARGLKEQRHGPYLTFIRHGVFLLCLPLIVGGASYLYDLYMDGTLYPFKNIAAGLPVFRQTFQLSTFFFSANSVKEVGLVGILGCTAVIGFIRQMVRGEWKTLILPAFLALPLLSSLLAYVLFGYYEGAQAYRHLLGTMALFVVLLAWAVSQFGDDVRPYGIWGGVGLIGIATVLGYNRQWPLHLPHTDLAAAALSLTAGLVIWALLAYRGRTGRLPGFFHTAWASTPVLLFSIWLGLWAVLGWQWLYRDLRYARWTPFYGFGTGWDAVANLTADAGARIAFNVGPYPLYGYDLQNRLFPLAPPMTYDDTSEDRVRGLMDWQKTLRERQIDYVYVFALGWRPPGIVNNLTPEELRRRPASGAVHLSENERFDVLTEWMTTHPEVFSLRFLSGREAVFALNHALPPEAEPPYER